MRRAKRTIVIFSLALAGCGGPVVHLPATPQVMSVHVMATMTTAPLLLELAEAYRQPDTLLSFDLSTVSWTAAHKSLLAGDVSYIFTSFVPATADLWVAPIGFDGIAIIVHPDVGVEALTQPELHALFSGRVESWAELGGQDVPVKVISYEAGADIRLTFETLALDGGPIALSARLALSVDEMFDRVSREPGAVGYISFSYLERADHPAAVRAASLVTRENAPPVRLSWATLTNASYPLRVPILVVGQAAPEADSIYRAWFAWMQSEAGQSIVARYQVQADLPPIPGQ